jgi:hypothetical protein
MKIDSSGEKPSNAKAPRIAMLVPGSNVKFEILPQFWKQQSPIIDASGIVLTDIGIQINSSAVQFTNARLSRIESLDSGSNTTLESVLQPLKHDRRIVPIANGKQMIEGRHT